MFWSPPVLLRRKLKLKLTTQKIRAALGLCLLTAATAYGQATATVTIQANQPGALASSNLFGIFFEEINFAGEGGLYAEMVRDRAFYNAANPDYWNLVTQGPAAGTMVVDPS